MVDGAAAVVSKEGQVILRSGGDQLSTAPRVYGPQPPPGVKEPPSSAFTRPNRLETLDSRMTGSIGMPYRKDTNSSNFMSRKALAAGVELMSVPNPKRQ